MDEEKEWLQILEDLTLLLIYLTSWKEKIPDGYLLRAWKGYDFNVLDELINKGFIFGSRRAKSVYLTDEGIARAEKIKTSIYSKDFFTRPAPTSAQDACENR